MTRLAAEIPFGVAPDRASHAASHAAHAVERDFNGRRDDSGGMAGVSGADLLWRNAEGNQYISPHPKANPNFGKSWAIA
jgi:hypothetical protein